MRQVVFVAGEIGIGKTAVVEAFVDGLTRDGAVWIGHGQRADAHEIVASVFSRFTEGFDMPDLRDARDLLAESTARPPRPRP